MKVEQDVLPVHDWMADASEWGMEQLPVSNAMQDGLAAFTTALVMDITLFALILNTMLVLLWMERKMLGRFMDRRGAITAMRSLWVGEMGTRVRWWESLPFGLRYPVGWVIEGIMFANFGSRSDLKTVDRVGDRSYWGIPLFPGFFQNIGDGMKLLTKEWMIPRNADRFTFEIAPVIITASTLLLFVFIPLSSGLYANDAEYNVLFMMAVFGVAPLGVFFAGWASNNKYTLIGGIRSAAQLTAYEIPLLVTVLSVCVAAGTFNMREIVQFQMDSGAWLVFMFPLGWLLFIITMVAEVERIPFDMPEAEAELVEGWWTEYGGMRWGMMFMSEYLRVYAACLLASIFFLGGWEYPFASLISGIPGLGWYDSLPGFFMILAKSWFMFAIFVWLRAALPRVRTDQILEFGWRWLLPLSLLNLGLAVIARVYWFDGSDWSWFDGDGGLLVPAVMTALVGGLLVAMAIFDDNHLPDRQDRPAGSARVVRD